MSVIQRHSSSSPLNTSKEFSGYTVIVMNFIRQKEFKYFSSSQLLPNKFSFQNLINGIKLDHRVIFCDTGEGRKQKFSLQRSTMARNMFFSSYS